jgi:hypothetical protein
MMMIVIWQVMPLLGNTRANVVIINIFNYNNTIIN